MASRYVNITGIDIIGSAWSTQVFTDDFNKALAVLRERAKEGAQAFNTADPLSAWSKPLVRAYVWDTEAKQRFEFTFDMAGCETPVEVEAR